MKTFHLFILVALLAITFVSMTWHDQQNLPPQVASHFDLAGMANDTMSRSGLLAFSLAISLGTSLFILGTFYLIRFFPPSILNVPHASYWRAPENYPRACAMAFRFGLWLVCGLLIWWTAFFHLVACANKISPPHLDGLQLSLLSIFFVIFMGSWSLKFIRSFRNVPPDGKRINNPASLPLSS